MTGKVGITIQFLLKERIHVIISTMLASGIEEGTDSQISVGPIDGVKVKVAAKVWSVDSRACRR